MDRKLYRVRKITMKINEYIYPLIELYAVVVFVSINSFNGMAMKSNKSN